MRFIKVSEDIIKVVKDNDGLIITNTENALDLLMTVKYDFKCSNIIIDKRFISEDFFDLSTKLAGQILQKYTNYQGRLAIIGDFSQYKSKSLKDFIYETNKGNSFFFVSTEEEAVKKLEYN